MSSFTLTFTDNGDNIDINSSSEPAQEGDGIPASHLLGLTLHRLITLEIPQRLTGFICADIIHQIRKEQAQVTGTIVEDTIAAPAPQDAAGSQVEVDEPPPEN